MMKQWIKNNWIRVVAIVGSILLIILTFWLVSFYPQFPCEEGAEFCNATKNIGLR